MGPLGWQETVFIFVLALLLFGPRKLPELGKTIGKALTEFRRASNDLKSTFDREMANLEKETEELKAETNKVHTEIQSTVTDGSYGYDYNYYDSGYDGYQPYETAGSSPSTVGASAMQGADSVPASNSAEAPGNPPAAPVQVGVEGTVPVQTASAAPPASAPVDSEPTPRNA